MDKVGSALDVLEVLSTEVFCINKLLLCAMDLNVILFMNAVYIVKLYSKRVQNNSL